MIDEISIEELAVVAAFARRLAEGSVPMVTVGELKREIKLGDAQARRVMESLNERGWLFVASTLNWQDDTQCILLGPGREKAEAMAEQLKKQNPESDAAS